MAFSFLSVLPLAMQQVQGLLLVCSQVTIITSGALVTEDSSVTSLHHQQVALLATANGTHIAVQVGRGMEAVGSRPEGEVRGGNGEGELRPPLRIQGDWGVLHLAGD